MKTHYYVYMLSNAARTIFFTGATANLEKRLALHQQGRENNNSFAGKHACYFLIYLEQFNKPRDAIKRAKQLKGISTAQRISIVQSKNPALNVLSPGITKKWPSGADSHSKFKISIRKIQA